MLTILKDHIKQKPVLIPYLAKIENKLPFIATFVGEVLSYSYKANHPDLNNTTMKILKLMLLASALLITTLMVHAEEPTLFAKGSRGYVLATYVNAMTLGKSKGLSEVIDASAKFSTLRGKQVISFDKDAVLNFADQNCDVRQNCITTTTEMESNNEMSIVKMEMRYENFTRINYVTLANTGGVWKITNVYSVFK